MTTRDEQIAAIRAVCIKINPEIVELKFGCVVEFFKTNGIEHEAGVGVILQTDYNGALVYTRGTPSRIGTADIEKIIGRPIRLTDVLLAIRNTNRDIKLEFIGADLAIGCDIENTENSYAKYAYYNLHTDDLTAQSDKTLSFLASLLASK